MVVGGEQQTVLLVAKWAYGLDSWFFRRYSRLKAERLCLAPISVGEIRSQVANGRSPRYIFALESNLKGYTSPARLGMQGCAAPHCSFIGWKTEKKAWNQKDLDFLDFFLVWKKDLFQKEIR